MHTRDAFLRVLCLAFAVVAAGCGDPRVGFVGTWKGPLKTIVRFSDGTSATYPKGEVTVVISAPERSSQLTFNGKCGMTATLNDERTFSINKAACPAERVTSDDGTLSCDLVESVNGGSGKRGETSLTISWFGDSQLTRCSDGFSYLATYTSEASLSE